MPYKIIVKTLTTAECPTCHRPELLQVRDYLQSSEGKHIVFDSWQKAERYIDTYTAEGRAKVEDFTIMPI